MAWPRTGGGRRAGSGQTHWDRVRPSQVLGKFSNLFVHHSLRVQNVLAVCGEEMRSCTCSLAGRKGSASAHRDYHLQPTSVEPPPGPATVLGAARPPHCSSTEQPGRPRPFKVTQPQEAQLEQAPRLPDSLPDRLGEGVPRAYTPPPCQPPAPGPCPLGAPAA